MSQRESIRRTWNLQPALFIMKIKLPEPDNVLSQVSINREKQNENLEVTFSDHRRYSYVRYVGRQIH